MDKYKNPAITRKSAFFESFGKKRIYEIRKYCDQINCSNADVFIIMARKAVCFIYVLFELGYISETVFNRIVVSDRTLDLEGLHLSGKKIELIDDIIISGSTLGKAISKLCTLGCRLEDIHITVLAYCLETCKIDFEVELGSAKYELFSREKSCGLSKAECVALSASIVKALIRIGVPYDIDFPSYQHIPNVFVNTLNVSDLYWCVLTSQNFIQREAGIQSYTLQLRESFWSQLDSFLGVNVHDIAQVRIRAYVCNRQSDDVYVKMQPMVDMYELRYDEVKKLFDKLLSLSNAKEAIHTIQNAFATPVSKFRFIQYVIAFVAGKLWFEHVGVEQPAIIRNTLKFIFGQHEYAMKDFLEGVEPNKEDSIYLQCEQADWLGYSPYAEGCDNLCDLLMNPFVYRYHNVELPAQKELADARKCITDSSVVEPAQRLEKGFSFRVLKDILELESDGEYNLEKAVSVFCDRAVDFGMIVPIIYDNGRVMCRAYRHGEDFAYADFDQKCLHYFLLQLYENLEQSEALSSTILDEIVVLYLQVGTSRDYQLVNHFKDLETIDELLSVQYDTQHASTRVFRQYPTEPTYHVSHNPYSTWILDRLTCDGVLIKVDLQKPGWYFRIANSSELRENANNYLTSETKYRIEFLAVLIAEWYRISKDNANLSVFRKHIEILTTCSTFESLARLMLAMIAVAEVDWQNHIRPFIDRYTFDSHEDIEKKLLDEIRGNRANKERTAFEGINFGKRTARWYLGKDKDENLSSVIDYVACLLRDKSQYGNLAAIEWNRLWAGNLRTENPDGQLSVYLSMLIDYTYQLNLAYLLLDYLALTTDKNNSADCVEIADEKELTREKVEKEIQKLIEEYASMSSTTNSVEEILQKVTSENLSVVEAVYILYKFLSQQTEQFMECRKALTRYLNRDRYVYPDHTFSRIVIAEVASVDVHSLCETIRKQVSKECRDYVGALIYNNHPQNGKALVVFLISDSVAHNDMQESVACRIANNLRTHNRGALVAIFDNFPGLNYEFYMWKNNMSEKWELGKKIVFPAINALHEEENGNSEEIRLAILRRKSNITNLLPIEETYRSCINAITPERDKGGADKRWEIKLRDNKNQNEEDYTVDAYLGKVINIGVITIIPCETAAVRDMLSLEYSGVDRSGRYFYQGNYITTKRQIMNIVMIQQNMPGNDEAALAYKDLVIEHDPDYVVLVGIAGSIDQKTVAIGDVLLPTQVIDLQKAKEQDGETRYQGSANDVHPIVSGIINAFCTSIYGKKLISPSDNNEFRVVAEPIATNNHVISDDDAQIKTVMKDFNRKAVGIDTESAGFLHTALTSRAGRSGSTYDRAIIVRGISDDTVNKPVGDTYHNLAAINAAYVLKLLLDFLT